MNKLQILTKLQEEKKIASLTEFADFLGIKIKTLYGWRSKNRYDIALLRQKFPDISPQWLATGEGSMYASGDEHAAELQVADACGNIPEVDRTAQIAALILHYGNGRTQQLAELLHLQPQSILSWKSRNTIDIIRCYHYLKDISADWLIAGRGPMIKPARPLDPSPSSGSEAATPTAIQAMARTIREQAEEIARLKLQLEESSAQFRLAAENSHPWGKE